MTFLHRCSSLVPYSVTFITVAVLATLLILTTTAEDSHAQSSVPAAPTGLTTTSVTPDSVTLTWDDPGDASVTAYLVLRRDTINQEPGTFTTIEPNTGSSATTYTDDTVTAETKYVYRVKAINPAGTSQHSNYVNVETPAAPTPSGPAQPTGLTATSVSHDSVTLGWDDPGDTSITGYQVLRRSRDGDQHGDGEGAPEFVAVVEDTGSSATTYTDTSVTAHTRYVYRLKAINPDGMSDRSSFLNVRTSEDPAVPAPPTGLHTSAVSHDSVTLTWDNPQDVSITGYHVLRRSRDGHQHGDGQGDPQFAAIAEDTRSAATTYTDTSVTPHTRYVYRVKAINDSGTSGQSNFLNVETPGSPPPPKAPTGLAASSASHDSITLTWDDPSDISITGYQVLRRSRDRDEYGDGLGAVEFVAIADDTGSPATTYTDESVEASTRYAYAVKARNPRGLSEPSATTDTETSETPADAAESGEQTDQPCENGFVPPTPTEVAITALPIVVESTVADYFVLYVSHEVDGETMWDPVKVVLGEGTTTTISENLPALPAERYRVEKYSLANPGDVDGDCTNDITELNDPAMSPLNPAATIESSQGAIVIPDKETFDRISIQHHSGLFYFQAVQRGDSTAIQYMKFILFDMDTAHPGIYFINSSTDTHHIAFIRAVGLERDQAVRGTLTYHPKLAAPDGSQGVYSFRIKRHCLGQSFDLVDRIHTLLPATIPMLGANFALHIRNHELECSQELLPAYRESRINLVFDEDVFPDVTFQALNPSETYGLLRMGNPDERPHSRDVVIYETLPNELPRVAGVISTVPQTPLSHVNLRALQDSIPNAFIAGALEDDGISDLIDSHVYYQVTHEGYSIRAATQAQVEEHYTSVRPAETQTPQRDLSVTSITPLSQIGFADWDSFGVKAANLAVLRTLGFPEGTVPDGFAVPFYFYDEFMKHNDLYDDVREMLADPDFQTDYDTKEDELKKLRKKIKKAETPEWIETALTEMHATYPEGQSLRYRSSTNNEDLLGFNGAGLYDSKTQHSEETEEDGISKSLKQVYASLWNFRAFIERDFHRVDHLAAAMGVLVHPNYSDELVNGVAVSTDPSYGTEGTYYVNSQIGEDLVTNPDAHSVPEEILLRQSNRNDVIAFSNQVPRGQLLMTNGQLAQLRPHLTTIHERFSELYGVEDGEQFAMEIEFKVTNDNMLAIKQARPWIFTSPDPAGNEYVALAATFEEAPDTHNGNPFTLKVRFSNLRYLTTAEFRDHALIVTGGTVTKAIRVNDRHDYWEITVTPSSPHMPVTLVLPENRPCTFPGAICTQDGQRLSTSLELTVDSLTPRAPDRPTGQTLSQGSVTLEWNDVPSAQTYNVQYRHADQWIDLPVTGTEIEFNEATAIVRVLPDSDYYFFRVQASNSHGASDWSDPLLVPVSMDWEAELTPGRNTNIFPVASGYSRSGVGFGTLSPDRFETGSTRHTVQSLSHSSDSLVLTMDQQLTTNFTLFVGNSVYRASDSLVPPHAEAGSYWWPLVPPEWSAGEIVRVGLIVHAGTTLEDRQKAPVTGYFENVPQEHDGWQTFSFRLHFSEAVDTTVDALRDHVLSVSGGAITGVQPVGTGNRTWTVSVTPHSHDVVTVEIEPGLDCALPQSVCTSDGQMLHNSMELPVEPRDKNPATGAPTINGALDSGQTLTVDTSNIADADGLANAVFSYQWISYDGSTHTDIPGATNSTYNLLPSDDGKAFTVRVSFTDDLGNQQSLTSAPARSDRPYGLSASESDGAVVLTWNLPTGSAYGSLFQILRNRPELGEDQPLVHVAYAQTNDNSYTDTDVEPEVLYVYRVKGVDPFGFTSEASWPVEIRTAGPDSTQRAPSRPNIVLILADDFGWGDIQTNNPDSAMTTPRIDSIAASGANFTDAHSPSSICSPTRYGLLTGRYAWRSWLGRGNIGYHDRPLIGPNQRWPRWSKDKVTTPVQSASGTSAWSSPGSRT